MAVLDIQNFPDLLARRIRALARRDRRSFAQEMIHLLTQAVEEPTHSIRELRGLGKAARRKQDAEAHVAAERDTWD